MFVLPVLLLGVSLLPIIRLPFFVYTEEFSRLIIVLFFGIFLLGLLIVGYRGSRREVVSTKAKKVIFLLLVVRFVSLVFSISPVTSVIGFYPFFTGGLLYWFFLLIFFMAAFRLRAEVKLIAQTLWASGVLVAVLALFDYFSHWQTDRVWYYRAVSTVGQPDRLAIYLLVILPIGWFLWRGRKSSIEKWVWGTGTLLTFAAFILTFSRTNFVAFAVLVSVFLWRERRRLGLGWRLMIVLPVLGVLLLFWHLSAGTFENLRGSSLELRLAELQAGSQAIAGQSLLRHFFGYGPETSFFTFFKSRSVIFNSSVEEFATGPAQLRNYYLELLSSTGVLGLAAYLVVYFYFLKRSLALYRQSSQEGWLFYGLVAVGLISFFYYQTEIVLILFWVMGGLVVPAGVVPGSAKQKVHRLYYLLVAAVIWLGGWLALATVALAHFYYGYATTGEQLKRVTEINPLFDVYKRDLAKVTLSEAGVLSAGNSGQAGARYLSAMSYAREALALAPLDVRNIQQLLLALYDGGVYVNRSYQQEALPYGEKLALLSPTDPNSWDLLGQVQLNLGDLDQAWASFERERQLAPMAPGVYLHLGEVAKQQGKIDQAIDLDRQAVSVSGGWDLAKRELEKNLQLKQSIAVPR